MSALRIEAALGAMLFAGACEPEPLPPARILGWMQCIECIAHELDSVVAMGSAAVPALRTLLIEGPPAQFVDQVSADLNQPIAGPGAAVSLPQNVVQIMLEDFKSNYRIRSSMALGRIGGNAARQALCDGMAQNFPRPDVVASIDTALVQVGGTCQ